MSEFFTTGHPNVHFDDGLMGQIKKKVWDMTAEEVDEALKEFDFPAPPELAKGGSYIQTTPYKEQCEIREKNDIVLIPVGTTENHGPHNPSGMDIFMVTAIAEGVKRYTKKHGPEVSIALPALMYGVHPQSHIGMPGTIMLHEETAINCISDVMLGLYNDGYRKQILISNHGHLPQLEAAIWRFAKDYQLPGIYRVVDWHRSVRELFALKEWGGEFETLFTHGCECETGCGLLCFPDMLNMDLVEDGQLQGVYGDGYCDTGIDSFRRPGRWEDEEGTAVMAHIATPNGVGGAATLATADKLKKPYLAVMTMIAKMIEEILKEFPAGEVPDPELTTLRTRAELEDFLKTPGSEGWRPIYGLQKCNY